MRKFEGEVSGSGGSGGDGKPRESLQAPKVGEMVNISLTFDEDIQAALIRIVGLDMS